MDERVILDKLTQILRDLLFDQSIILSRETTRAEVPGWDSFAYINFIVSVEMTYGVKFSVTEVESFGNVGEIVSRIMTLDRGGTAGPSM